MKKGIKGGLIGLFIYLILFIIFIIFVGILCFTKDGGLKDCRIFDTMDSSSTILFILSGALLLFIAGFFINYLSSQSEQTTKEKFSSSGKNLMVTGIILIPISFILALINCWWDTKGICAFFTFFFFAIYYGPLIVFGLIFWLISMFMKD